MNEIPYTPPGMEDYIRDGMRVNSALLRKIQGHPEAVTDQYRIKEGDIVRVNFNNSQFTLCYSAVVVAMPCATGDSWIFRDPDTGLIHYVSEGCTITKGEFPKPK